jgi:hypothetical protein
LALYNRLKQAGYKPWLHKKDLIPGQIWRDEIPKAIKASQIFLACLSPMALGLTPNFSALSLNLASGFSWTSFDSAFQSSFL